LPADARAGDGGTSFARMSGDLVYGFERAPDGRKKLVVELIEHFDGVFERTSAMVAEFV
jgi:hypothetical protein